MRRRRYRLGQTDSAASAASGFLNPRTGNLLVGAGALAVLGTVGYYVWKGGEFGDLFGDLFSTSGGGKSGGGRSQFTAPRENITLRRPAGTAEIPSTPEGQLRGLAMIPRFTPSYSYGATDIVPGVRPDTW